LRFCRPSDAPRGARRLRCAAWLAVVVLSKGCASPEPAAPVSFEGLTLSTERLAELLVLGQPMPVDDDAALRLAEHWLEMAALGRAVLDGADGALPVDVPEAALRWELHQTVRERYLSERAPTRTVTREEVELLYDSGELRLIAHVVRVASPRASRAEQNRQEQVAGSVLQRLREGGSWEEANASNEDPSTAGRNGILGLFARGELSPPLDRAAFALQPGAISDVVPSPVGFHVLYRPRLEDVRSYFTTLLEARGTRIRREAVADSMARAAGTAVAEGGVEALRSLAVRPHDPEAVGDRVLVRFDSLTAAGEGMTSARVVEALRRLSADERRDVARGTRAQLEAFLYGLARDRVVWRAAVEAGVEADDADRAFLEATYRADLTEATEALDLTPGADRNALGRAVDAYLEAVVARRRSQVTVPPGLASMLLASGTWEWSDEGLERAVTRASSLLQADETAP